MQNKQNNTHLQKAQPLVTFIVTYYNLPIPMLCECINSIMALSLKPEEREILIIDDGSEVSPMNGLMPFDHLQEFLVREDLIGDIFPVPEEGIIGDRRRSVLRCFLVRDMHGTTHQFKQLILKVTITKQ